MNHVALILLIVFSAISSIVVPVQSKAADTGNSGSAMRISFHPIDFFKEPMPLCGAPRATAFALIEKQVDFFTRPNSTSAGIIATVWTKKDGKKILNPKIWTPYIEVDYGGIPPLAKMTTEICDELFCGKIRDRTCKEATYELVNLKPGQKKVFLDTVFENKQLLKYRIRENEEKTADWTTVQSAGSEVFRPM